MSVPRMKFALSSNGDQWFLERVSKSSRAQVVHTPNVPSGGSSTRQSIEQFLERNPSAPERVEFLKLVEDILGNELDETNARKDVLLIQLRDATEEDAINALQGGKVRLPLTSPYEALEFFNIMVDVITGQRAREKAEDANRIKAGFGSTHQ